MRIIFQILLLFSLSSHLLSAEKIEFVIGLVDDEYNEYKFADAEIALRKWMKKLSKLEDANVTLKVFDTYEEYNKAVRADEVQSTILSPEFYLRHYKSFKETHYDGWMKEDNQQFFAYTLIGNEELYKNKKHLRASYFEHDLIAKIILEKIALRDKKIFTYRAVKKESKAVLDTFFNKSDVALVGSKDWKINCELNPQVGKKLQLIKSTDAIFMKNFSLISKKMQTKTKEIYFDVLSRLDESIDGRQMMRMFKFNTIYPITTDQLKSLEDFYDEYLKIKSENE